MKSNVLETEIEFFEQHREEFVAKAGGKFALVKGQECLGFFDDEYEAYRFGAEKLGRQPFLIKEVLPKDRIESIPAYCLGRPHVDF